jgi:hypothetical protein
MRSSPTPELSARESRPMPYRLPIRSAFAQSHDHFGGHGMSEEHAVSRGASLKTLGAAGAVFVLGGPAATARQAGTKNAAGNPEKPAGNPVEVAVARFAKGHS